MFVSTIAKVERTNYQGKPLDSPSAVRNDFRPEYIPRASSQTRFVTITVAHPRENDSILISPKMFRSTCEFPTRRHVHSATDRVESVGFLDQRRCWSFLVSRRPTHSSRKVSDSISTDAHRRAIELRSSLPHRISLPKWRSNERFSVLLKRNRSTHLAQTDEFHS